jgi:hypothetical protein
MMRDDSHEYIYLLVRILWRLQVVSPETVNSALSRSAGKRRWA